jgi:hypothetical protein
MAYDPDHDPDPTPWLAMSEADQIAACEATHRVPPAGHPPIENLHTHAAMHAVVETELARDWPPGVRQALARLKSEGLARHDAIHALISVVSLMTLELVRGERERYEPMRHAALLRELHRKDWKP